MFKKRFTQGFVDDICNLAIMCDFYESDNVDIEIDDPNKQRKLKINIKFIVEEGHG